MFRMINFQKLVETVFNEKHHIPKRCKHKVFEKYASEIDSFLGI